MITNSTRIDKGFISGQDVETVIDLGQHAYADTFIARDQLHLSEPVFPLQVALDQDSGHLQLRYISSAQDRYNLYPYSYTSSNSDASRHHWESLAENALEKYNTKGLVLEIGSNDGYLLKQFQAHGLKILGVDGSRNICDIARANGVPTLNAVFDLSIAEGTWSSRFNRRQQCIQPCQRSFGICPGSGPSVVSQWSVHLRSALLVRDDASRSFSRHDLS